MLFCLADGLGYMRVSILDGQSSSSDFDIAKVLLERERFRMICFFVIKGMS